MTKMQDEKSRIKEVYDSYKQSEERRYRYSYLNADILMSVQEKERAIIKFLKKVGINRENIKDKKLIEIGAGMGSNLRQFLEYGFSSHNLTYNEIIDRGLEGIKACMPDDITYIIDDGRNIDKKYDNYFDVVFVSTVFSSILDSKVRKELAQKIFNITKKQGIILFYDFIFDNPQNRNVHKITYKEIKGYFGDCIYYKKRLMLAPPIARRIAKVFKGVWWYNLMNWQILRTHLLTLIIKHEK